MRSSSAPYISRSLFSHKEEATEEIMTANDELLEPKAVTGASLGKRTLKFLDYGKLAATFLNVETGKAVRTVALESSRRLADLKSSRNRGQI